MRPSDVVPVGIIPAYAGSTRPSCRGRRRRTDHPRIRGEHRKGGKSLTINKGSSPHTRGAPIAKLGEEKRLRIIPAYAGSTLYEVSVVAFPADHPRIRGEHLYEIDVP